ncbi:MAG: ACT domain-containing protein [Kiritimatiellales bacterium]|nr:ACT domain-containing protein [Kiritimatiellota bacterium]MBL7012152.1 ACT domain-containing protein [Kiritimatiellales bacterium]
MKKVLIPTKLDPVAKELLEANGNYTVVQDDSADLATLAAQNPDTYALFVRSEKVTAEIIDALPSLKVVIRAGAGYNTIDIKHARAKKIDVMNTPGANANAVAEEVIALMLADARHVVPADASTRAGKWEKKNFMGREVTGKTVGIVGLGAIGRLVARRLSGFDVKVLAFDPVLSEEAAERIGVKLVSLADLFAQSDYVSLHIPENEHTKGLINKTLLGNMKTGATLINCARAGVINEDDLRAVKPEKGLRFLNDVYAKDAEGDKTVTDIADIMVPHLGASTHEANYNAARRSAEQLIDFDEKGVTSYIVNRDIPEGLDEAYADLAFTIAKLTRTMIGTSTKLSKIETSFYGELQRFSNWLTVPVVCALSNDFDRSMDEKAAISYLEDMGIDYDIRPADESKGYGNTITVDLVARVDEESLKRISVRGTVAEGRLMISRIGGFDGLYFEPKGHLALFTYRDRPGVLSQIAGAMAEANINIDDVRNPHDESGERSIAILKVSQPVPGEILEKVAAKIDALSFCSVSF